MRGSVAISLGVATLPKKMLKKQRDAGVVKSGRLLLQVPCTSSLVDLRVRTKSGQMDKKEVGLDKRARGHMTRERQRAKSDSSRSDLRGVTHPLINDGSVRSFELFKSIGVLGKWP